MTEQQHAIEQAEPIAEQHDDAGNLVVILTDGTVLTWPAKRTAFVHKASGSLHLYPWDAGTNTRSEEIIAIFAPGQWATMYDDQHLAS
ncbi:hypothetical protein [Pseudonocardia sp.]|uniref:hypothetical protein n=1 Tax=Pseudonocardia sp. TaxID=60912 RepID=UPI003D0F2383